MSILTQDTMIGKRVKLLDGERVKIVGALKSSYKLDNGDKLPAKKIIQKGRSFVETDLTPSKVEDTGMGFVVPKEEETKSRAKAKPSRGRAKAKAGEKPRRGRRTKAEKDEEEKPTRRRRGGKAKKEEKPTRSRGTAQSKSSTSRKRKAKVEEAPKPVERDILDFSTGIDLGKIRQLVQSDVQEMLLGAYSNIVSVVCETVRNDEDLERGELRLQIFVDRPLPEHHSKDFYMELAREAGASLKTPGSGLQAKLAERLDVEDEGFEINPGDVLIDEEGNRFVFGGLNSQIKRLILVDITNEQIVEASLNTFDGLDYQDTFEAVLGAGIEDVQAADQEVVEEDFDLEDEKPALSSIEDWGSVPVDEMVDLIIGNYSRDEIVEFIQGHEDLEATDEDLDAETEDLVRLVVELLSESNPDEEFEEDEDLTDDVSDLDEETEIEEVSAIDVDALKAELIEEEFITGKMAARMSDEDVIAMYQEEIGELPVEEELAAEEVELTAEEMRDALIEEELLTPKMAARMSDEDVAALYAEELGGTESADDLEADLEDDIEDEADEADVEDEADEADLEDEDDIEDEADEDAIEDEDVSEQESDFDDLDD